MYKKFILCGLSIVLTQQLVPLQTARNRLATAVRTAGLSYLPRATSYRAHQEGDENLWADALPYLGLAGVVGVSGAAVAKTYAEVKQENERKQQKQAMMQWGKTIKLQVKMTRPEKLVEISKQYKRLIQLLDGQDHKRVNTELRQMALASIVNDPVLPQNMHTAKLNTAWMNKIVSSKSFDQFRGALNKAIELNNQGYLSFFHGQKNSYACMNDIGTTLLYRLAGRQKDADFEYLRFPDLNLMFKASSPEMVVDTCIESTRTYKDTGHGDTALALNFFPFGNVDWASNNTWHYVTSNYNETEGLEEKIFYTILRNYGLSMTPSTQAAIKVLISLADSTYETGRLLLVAWPYNSVAEYVKPWNYTVHTDIYRYGKHKMAGQDVWDSVDKIIEVLGTQGLDPKFEELDKFHCVMPLTPAGPLNPESGIKIFVFDNPVSERAQRDFEKIKEAVIDGIIARLQKVDKLEQAQERSRAYLQWLHEVHIARERRLTGK